MTDSDALWKTFLDVQDGLPRQGPGDAASTRRALALCTGLPATPSVLDLGCGPGMQTLVLAEALAGPITAVDLVDGFLDQLRARAAAAGVADRVTALEADMGALPFPPESFDLLWAEGSAYSIGIGHALRSWTPLLRPGGYLAVTELVWLIDEPPAEAASFFAAEYPAMADVPTLLALVEGAGLEPMGHFVLPDTAWWTDYYTPLEAKLPTLRARYAADPDALAVVENTAREIDVRRRYGDAYGYAFAVGRRA
ncbi:MAG: class I SAM-dependent methyltransferase [Pseudomonadota bacterium]